MKDQQEKVCSERQEILTSFLRNAFKNYCNKNQGKRPEQIIIYRDGVGGPSYEEFVIGNEGHANGGLQNAIRQFAPNYTPKILYILINKKVTTRLFERDNGLVINPGPGTLVDTAIVEKDGNNIFDFFMIANDNPKTATALPVHYSIVCNTTGLSKREIEEITHQQCYSYQGFGGPIKVPAAAKYAEKLANYAHDTKVQKSNISLSHKLHYL
jgi:aubergine-like protein